MSDILPFAPPVRTRSVLFRTEKRRWKRVSLQLPVTFLDETGLEHRGETINIGAGGLLFQTSHPPFRGQRVICYIDGVGRISGHVVRSAAGQVAIVSDAPFTKREKLADLLTWLANKDVLGLEEERRSTRTTARLGVVLVQTQDGRELRCHVIDMSFVGVALATSDKFPLVGDMVQVGSQQGRVARYLAEGFAVDFTRR